MKKIKYLTLMAAALLTGFTSCSNDEDNSGKIDSGTPKSVFLKISNNAPATYSEGTPQDEASVEFQSGDLYFTNTSGMVKKHYTITSGETSDTNISMSALTGSGAAILNLPADVSAVYVVGNTSGLPTTGKISDIKATALQVKDQVNIASVNLYGETTTLNSTGVNTYDCTVNLAPTVARFELTDITATGNVITGFKVKGIFVDNYYSQAAIGGTVTEADFVNNGPVPAAFQYGSTQYPASLTPAIYDWYNTTLKINASGTPLVAKPTEEGDVWSYNLFATAGTGSAVPRIVIRLSDIETNPSSGITYTEDQFITIRSLKKGNASLASIEAGKVYNIGAGALSFDETVLTGTPNLGTIDVDVKVTLASWSVVNVTPEI